MKYAFITFSTPDSSLEEILATARQYGYAGVEARCGVGQKHGIELSLSPEQRLTVKRTFEASGIKLTCISLSSNFANPDTVEGSIRETKEYIRLARDLGVSYIRVFCGIISSDVSRDEARERIIGALRTLAPEAEQAGVVLTAETHDDWSDPREMAAVMEAVSHPGVGVVWDVMHTIRTGHTGMEEAYRILKPWIRHVHFHDGLLDPERLVFLPIGSGEIDHRPVVRVLIENDYQGYLSGEWIDWEPGDVHLPREIEAMLAYERELRN